MIGSRLRLDLETYEIGGVKKSSIDAVYESSNREVFGGALLETDIPEMSPGQFLQYVQTLVQQKPQAIRRFIAELLLAEFGYSVAPGGNALATDFRITRCLRASSGESELERIYYAFDGVETCAIGSGNVVQMPAWTLMMSELHTCLREATLDSVAIKRIESGGMDSFIHESSRGTGKDVVMLTLKSNGQEMTIEYQGQVVVDNLDVRCTKEVVVLVRPVMSWFIEWFEGAVERTALVTRMVEMEELSSWIP